MTAVTALYGVIGYLDDSLKIKRKDSGGLSMRAKLAAQFADRARRLRIPLLR